MKQSIKGITKSLTFILLVVALVLSACSGGEKNTQSVEVAAPTQAPTPTPEPKTRLTVCLGEEPQSLYMYGNSSQAMWSVLEALYDGPIDTINNEPLPVILGELPTQANGGVLLGAVAVTRGDRVANTEGDVVSLQAGVRVFPAGCTSADCAVEWDGESELSLVQMSATFDLLPGILWSDGQPLTAADSVFSYQVSADPDTKVTKTMLDRTADYSAVDEQTIKWTAVPGYLTTRPASYFWIPLPKHILENYTAAQLNKADETNKNPLGWGAYQIVEWVPGSEIKMVRNANYFKASEGKPAFDELVYKFLPTVVDADLSPLVNDECDILDPSVGLDDQIQTVRELEVAGRLTSYFGQGPSWTGINFGIKPSSYDDVYNPYDDRADFFADVRVRQAFAYCIDREKIIADVMFSQSPIPAAYLPTTNPLYVDGLPIIGHDTEKGIQLLDQVGWRDFDFDPSTPRTASGVENVFNNTEFAITYETTDTTQNRQIADIVVNSLQECGVKMEAEFYQPSELLAVGPEGTLFGRDFDLAQLSWYSGNLPSCFLYASSEIPTAKNDWLGTKYGGINLTGYSNAEYDTACAGMLTAGLDQETYNQDNQITQQILANDLPVLPLFYNLKVMAARTDLCGLSIDTSSRSALSGIEGLSLSSTCAP